MATVGVVGRGGKQILAQDPAENPVELFEPAVAEARRRHLVVARTFSMR